MRAAEALVLLAALAIGTLAAARWVWRHWRARRAPWVLAEHSLRSEGHVIVQAEHPLEAPMRIGDPIPFSAPDFDSQLYERRAQGHEKVYALNQKENQ